MSRSHGAVLFVRIGATQAELAAKLGVSSGIVAMWGSGERRPGLSNRKKICAKYKIPIESWDEPAPSPVVEAPKVPPTPPWGKNAAIGRIEMLESMITTMIERVYSDEQTTPLEASKVIAQLVRAEKELRSLKGENAPEMRVLRHPKWQSVKRALLESLKKYPDALKAVIASLDKLEEQRS